MQTITNQENEFLKRIKVNEDTDKLKLLNIQNELERRGINPSNVFELTKDLSNVQKKKLEQLYKEQIEMFRKNIENCKNKILFIRKNF